MKFHCKGAPEDSEAGRIGIEKYSNDICRINRVVFIRYHFEFIARDILGYIGDAWYARIDESLFPPIGGCDSVDYEMDG